jgi:hypothetical protein
MNKRTKIIIGVLLGLTIIGGIYYYYNKKKVEQPLTVVQKKNREIIIKNLDF